MNGRTGVRLRRAYFDTRFGQLHVHTAFPGTGGFDEHTTLFCIHGADSTGRVFGEFLARMAADRSVYAPDLPGNGESDGGPEASTATSHAQALSDLARDLRLRRIDVLGLADGCRVAETLAVDRPDLVRRVVVVAQDPRDCVHSIAQPMSVLRLGKGAEFGTDVLEARPEALARAVKSFLDRS